MAISLNSTLTLTDPTKSFSHYQIQNPKKHHSHGLSFASHKTRATAGATAHSTTVDPSKANIDLYKILSLKPQESNREEIKKAYRNMALKYHPDVYNQDQSCSTGKEESTKKFLQVHAAYKTLSDPVLRNEYDEGLPIGFGSKGFRGSTMADFDDLCVEKRWRQQLDELKRLSVHRMAHKGNSWASKIRSQNTKN